MKMIATLALALGFVILPGEGFAQAACTPPVGGHCVDLAWTASPTVGVTYNVYRGTVAGACKVAPKVSSGSANLSFSDNTVVNGTTYFYAVSASGTGGESACAAEVQAQIPVPPQPPTGLSAVVR